MLSRSQIDRLGDRLKVSEPTRADETLLEEWMCAHLEALRQVLAAVSSGLEIDIVGTLVERVEKATGDGTVVEAPLMELAEVLRSHSAPAEIRTAPTARLKSLASIRGKLQRSTGRLSQMQDLAGVRVVIGESKLEQSAYVDALASRFEGARVIDRRSQPSAGYRAVHVVVSLDGMQVEVQVRTGLQHLHAEAMEKLADQVGRDIRYVAQPGRARVPRLPLSSRRAIRWLTDAADGIERYEDTLAGVELLERGQALGLELSTEAQRPKATARRAISVVRPWLGLGQRLGLSLRDPPPTSSVDSLIVTYTPGTARGSVEELSAGLEEAIAVRSEIQARTADSRTGEVVLLAADSCSRLPITHGRYYYGMTRLLWPGRKGPHQANGS